MNWLTRLLKRKRLEDELERELRFHIENQTADNVRNGMTEGEARRTAQLQFGSSEGVREECRDARGVRWIDVLFQDTKFALRMMRKNTLFSMTAVLSLAIGLGANVALFTAVNGVLLKKLPVEDP